MNADYDSIRERHAAKHNDRKLLSLDAARANRHADRLGRLPARRRRRADGAGARCCEDYPLAELRDYIDWQPFFNAWEMKGRFPDILNNPATGEAARRLYDDAQAMLDRIIEEKWLRANGVLGLFPANAVGDDIEVYTDDVAHRGAHDAAPPAPAGRAPRRRTQPVAGRLRGAPGDRAARPRRRVRGHRRPRQPGRRSRSSRTQLDDYSAILLESLADRLAEAFAERLHERVRTEFWGYAPDESLDNEALLKERVRRHPARPGLPGLPRPHREGRRSGSCSTSRRTPGSR